MSQLPDVQIYGASSFYKQHHISYLKSPCEPQQEDMWLLGEGPQQSRQLEAGDGWEDTCPTSKRTRISPILAKYDRSSCLFWEKKSLSCLQQ